MKERIYYGERDSETRQTGITINDNVLQGERPYCPIE
jgi:hypothetical protein